MKHPHESLRAFPLLRREGGRRQWPGEARSTASARKACSAAIGQVTLCLCHRTHPKEN